MSPGTYFKISLSETIRCFAYIHIICHISYMNNIPMILTRASDLCWAGLGCRGMANGPKRANMGLKRTGRRRQTKRKWVLPILLVICSDYYSRLRSGWSSSTDIQPQVGLFIMGESECGATFSNRCHRQKLRKEVMAMMELGFACHFFHLNLTLVFKSGLVANLATRWPHWHCHNALDCLIGIISLVLTWYLHSSSARATSVKSLTDRHPHGSDLGKKWQKMNKMDKMLQHFLSTLLSIQEPGWLTGSFPLAMFILKETRCSI